MQEDYKKALEVLKEGGLCILPSDTCYMLAVDATNQKAVDKLLELKNGLIGKPISVVMGNQEMVNEYCQINQNQLARIESLLPGPYTLVLPAKKELAVGIVSKQMTLGIRIPDQKDLIDLVTGLGKPITATSALIYGETIPYSLGFINKLPNKKRALIDWIVDGGKLAKNNLSTIVNMVEGTVLERRLLIKDLKTKVKSLSELDTGKLAKNIFEQAGLGSEKKGLIFLLTGELGGGKTTFAKYLGKMLGVRELITSPTFNIYDEYDINFKGFKKFLHADLYRLNNKEDFENINFDDWFGENKIACVEWPEKMDPITLEALKNNYKVITVGFEYLNEKSRIIRY